MTGRLQRVFPHTLAAALCLGLAAALVVHPPTAALTVGAVLAALAAAAARPAFRSGLLAVVLFFSGCWWASVRVEALERSALVGHVGESALSVVVVTGPARRGLFALRLPAELRRFGMLSVRERVLLELPLGRSPPQGAVLELVAKIALPRGPERGFDESTWLRRRGIHVVVDGAHWRMIGRRGGMTGFADKLRARIARTLAPGLGGERRAVIAGIVLGEDEGLDNNLRDDFRASGLYHLLAVSGQNVAFLAGGVLLVAWLAGIPRWLGEIGVLAAISGYVLAVGWQPSVVRAGVAGGLASLAWLTARPRDRWYVLLLGAVVLLAWNPYTLLEPGFQLSFSAVVAIFVAVPRIRLVLAGYPVPRWIGDAVAVSVACGVATAPILWLQFGAVPVFSVLANALAVPVVAPLLGLGLACSALEPLLPTAAVALAWANGWLAAYLAWSARLVGGLPHAEVTSLSEVGLAVAAVGAAVLVTLARGRRRTVALLLVSLVCVLSLVWYRRDGAQPPADPRGLRVTVLDVGQGDATLLQVPGGAVLVDEGPPEARVADQLRALGVGRLDLIVMTHPSRDNIGGAEEIIRRLDVGLVLDPALPFDNPFGGPALAEARRRGIPVTTARAGRGFRLGRLRLSVLWPDGRARPGEDPNDHATVLLASYGDVDLLLPADAESNVTLRLRPPAVEVLKVGHHGSKDSGLSDLLRRTRPRVALISVGKTNDYGHPAPSTMAALAAVNGLRVYRTDHDGRVTIESDGRTLEVRPER